METSKYGQCYKYSYEYVLENPSYKLIHGYVTNIFSPYQTIDHVWCMKDNIVYDAVMENEYKWEIYKILFQAEIDKEYTFKETYELALKYKTYGAWHELRDLNLEKFYNKNRKLKEKYMYKD